MKTFLETVANDIINKYGNDLSRIAVVFPNKRAYLFMNSQLARLTKKPLWSPAYITISELFRRHSSLHTADDIKLICDLNKVFNQSTGLNETLDKFFGWGQLLLSDFDDIDKNMADADKVFANLKDIHELDDVSYLNEEQKEILKKFFSNFSEEHNTELKKRFLSLWSHFDDIYHGFNNLLSSQGLAYEGALYRNVVEDTNVDFEYDTYLFIGFNMMQKVELRLFDRLKKTGRAKFYWDFDKYYMPKETTDINTNINSRLFNEAGTYIYNYLHYYPNELDNKDPEIYDNFSKKKDITYVSAPTENIQARYIADWLRQNGRLEDGRKTAIVMANEKMLQTVIHCLPPEAKRVNITTGYPLAQSPFNSLISLLIQMQTIGHKADSNRYRLHYINPVLHHPYIKYVSEKYEELINDLQNHKRFYPLREELALDEGLELLFKDLDESSDKSTDNTYNRNLEIINWLILILKRIGVNSKNNTDDPLFQESLFRMYTLINRLRDLTASGDLDVNIMTLNRLINQLIQSTSIPFHGEPAVGLQVMGVLETRNLDFDHVLLLSCNEGNLPKGVDDASFIPYSIRKAYGLTTIDNKVAIYAYYYHSLLQRANDITITYNNSTADGKTGEMSRFMLQMLVESNHTIKQESLKAGQTPISNRTDIIEKDDDIMKKLDDIKSLSPSAINKYIRCKMSFYYRYIAEIMEPDDTDEDDIDNRVFGNIFHKAAQYIYLSFASEKDKRINDKGEIELINPIMITRGDIEGLMKDKTFIERIVDDVFREELFKIERKNYHPEYNGLQLINREVIIGYLKQLMYIDMNLTPFSIIGLEMKVEKNIDVNGRIITLRGFIDRLDSVDNSGSERIRVIDYKTGRNPQTAIKSIEEIFSGEKISNKHTDYFLQAILYSLIIRQDPNINKENLPVSPALLFIIHATGENYDPTLEINKEKIIDAKIYKEEFIKQLKITLSEIFDKEQPFLPTEDKTRCSTCPYKQLCGQ